MEFPTYITVIARIFKTQERLDEFKAFFADKLDQPALTREIKMDTEVIQSRVNLISRQKEAVVKAITAALRLKFVPTSATLNEKGWLS